MGLSFALYGGSTTTAEPFELNIRGSTTIYNRGTSEPPSVLGVNRVRLAWLLKSLMDEQGHEEFRRVLSMTPRPALESIVESLIATIGPDVLDVLEQDTRVARRMDRVAGRDPGMNSDPVVEFYLAEV